jgi:hypothetical protein
MDSIEGRIVAIAESWPMQLSVQPDQGPGWTVMVGENTGLTRHGSPLQASALRIGQRLRATGSQLGLAAQPALQAQTVELL